MNEKILTVSIAAYNMEKYIRQALDSLVDDRVIDDLEVFVIDDGGTDRTLEIAKEYAAKYPNSIFPVHKENGGYGSTVNYSIAHATGKYFKLLDGDDWYDTDELYEMLKPLKEMEADVIVLPYKKGPSAEQLELVTLIPIAPSGEVVGVERLPTKNVYGMWALAYKTQILKMSGVELPEYKLYTDQIYSTIPFSYCKRVTFLDLYVYCYRVGRDGQSVSRESRIKHAQDMLDSVVFLCQYYSEHQQEQRSTYPYIRLRLTRYYLKAIKTLLLKPYTKESLHELKELETTIAKVTPVVYRDVLHEGKMGIFIRIMRWTNYSAYWMLKLFGIKIKNWA